VRLGGREKWAGLMTGVARIYVSYVAQSKATVRCSGNNPSVVGWAEGAIPFIGPHWTEFFFRRRD
jgi:hypothetical protein